MPKINFKPKARRALEIERGLALWLADYHPEIESLYSQILKFNPLNLRVYREHKDEIWPHSRLGEYFLPDAYKVNPNTARASVALALRFLIPSWERRKLASLYRRAGQYKSWETRRVQQGMSS